MKHWFCGCEDIFSTYWQTSQLFESIHAVGKWLLLWNGCVQHQKVIFDAGGPEKIFRISGITTLNGESQSLMTSVSTKKFVLKVFKRDSVG